MEFSRRWNASCPNLARNCQRHPWTESMDGDHRWAAWAFRAWWFDPAVATVGFAVPIYTYWALEIRHAKAGRPAQCRCFLLSWAGAKNAYSRNSGIAERYRVSYCILRQLCDGIILVKTFQYDYGAPFLYAFR